MLINSIVQRIKKKKKSNDNSIELNITDNNDWNSIFTFGINLNE